MKPWVLLISVVIVAVLLAAVAWGVISARATLRSVDADCGQLDLKCEPKISGEREVAVNISWKWTERNPHPGMCDEVVILGPDTWCSIDEPGTKPPISSGTEVQFGAVGDDAAKAVTRMVEAGNVKAYAAIRPNEDGNITIYLKTKADPVAFEVNCSAQYLKVKRVPNPTQCSTLTERLLRLFGTDHMEIFVYEKQMPLGPWFPPDIDGGCPGYVGEYYFPSLMVDDPNPDLEKVAMDLMTDFLEHHMAADQPDGQRLSDYIIEEIVIHEEDSHHFSFSVRYSLKPVTMATFWGAGNGMLMPNGWIEDKGAVWDVARDGNVFTMSGGGTGGK